MHSASFPAPDIAHVHQVRSRTRALAAVVLLAAMLLNLAPIWLVQYPPLQDYPNHLARIYLIAHLSNSAAQLQPFYHFEWLPYPNLFIDVVGWLLHLLLPIYAAGKILLSLYVLAWPLAVVYFYSCVTSAPRWPAWTLGLLTVYNHFFIAGFLNFCFAIIFCLLALGAWLRWRDSLNARRLLLLALLAEITFLTHIYGFFCLAMALASYEFAGALRRGGISRTGEIFTADFKKLLAGGAILVPALLTAIPWLGIRQTTQPPDFFTWPAQHLLDKGTMAFAPLRSVLDRTAGIGSPLDVALVLLLTAFVLFTLRRPWFRDWRLLAPLTAFFLFFWFHNEGALDGVNSDTRVILPFYVIAFSVLNLRPRRVHLWYAAFALIFAARMAALAGEWRASDDQLQEYARGFARISAGARVCPAVVLHRSLPMRISPELHFPSYLVIDRGAALSSLFAKPQQQPLRITESFQLASEHSIRGRRVNWAALAGQCDFVWTYDASPQHSAEFGPPVFSAGRTALYERAAHVATRPRRPSDIARSMKIVTRERFDSSSENPRTISPQQTSASR